MLVIHIVIQSQSNAMRGLSHQNPADDMHTSNNKKNSNSIIIIYANHELAK